MRQTYVKRVEITIHYAETPEEDAPLKQMIYAFPDIAEASISSETLTRDLSWEEQAERGFPALREKVVVNSKVTLELTTKEPKK